ncbi:hypothetical protein ACA910_011623 [Epithemia clementina (nom. ined.)]
MTPQSSYWKATTTSSAGDVDSSNGNHLWSQNVNCLCIGTGRFLRSVLVPLLTPKPTPTTTSNERTCGSNVVLIQPRGRNFVDFIRDLQKDDDSNVKNSYPVDTVLSDGTISTDWIPIVGVFSWGRDDDRHAFYQECLPHCVNQLQIIGVGVTEAGFASSQTTAMQHLFQLFQAIWERKCSSSSNSNTTVLPLNKLIVINTDNVPNNGSVIQQHMLQLAKEQQQEAAAAVKSGDSNEQSSFSMSLLEFLQTHVLFLNSMVDRIVSCRSQDEDLIPKAEPTPSKALVLLDPHQDLPEWFTTRQQQQEGGGGLVIRHSAPQLQADVALKLRIANATHTAIAHAMALQGVLNTTALASSNNCHWIISYLDELVQHQIVPACLSDESIGTVVNQTDVEAVWKDWRGRLLHSTFGISTFFITQNGAAKGGIRFGPTLANLLVVSQSSSPNSSTGGSPQVSLAYALAVLLRWLTPDVAVKDWQRPLEGGHHAVIYRGKLARIFNDVEQQPQPPSDDDTAATVTYADGLRYNLQEGWYEFKCDCRVTLPDDDRGQSPSPQRPQQEVPLAQVLADLAVFSAARQPHVYVPMVRAYLTSASFSDPFLQTTTTTTTMGNRRQGMERDVVHAVATLYARFMAGDSPLSVLQEIVVPPSQLKDGDNESGRVPHEPSVFCPLGCQTPCEALMDDPTKQGGASGRWVLTTSPLHYRPYAIPDHSALLDCPILDQDEMASVVIAEVASVQVIDLHTHLLPPEHGPLCLWGIDELLTYHYLVAEFFITAPPSITPKEFLNEWTKEQQANAIWQALFIDRLPLSEACRGVITTLAALGLHEPVQTRDLTAIRAFYQSFRQDGLAGAQRFSNLIFRTAGLRYNVMTNIPFEAKEAHYWKNKTVCDTIHYKSAVRVDPLLKGDVPQVKAALQASGYPVTLEGARHYLRDWCDVMQPEYVMASTPHDFGWPGEQRQQTLHEGPMTTRASSAFTTVQKTKASINPSALQQPGAFAEAILETSSAAMACVGGGRSTAEGEEEEDLPSVINESSDYFREVLMKVCQERDLPLALKIGAHRAVNPSLQQAGDGVVAFCDTTVLRRLCTHYPQVRFLATFLSRNNQHEACVLATKFRNLHLYGCWWFCNNPSIVREITRMRVELLGTAFTSQHSDARVLDQLVYKWAHSRAVIAQVLVAEYQKLLAPAAAGGGGWVATRREIRRDVRRLFGGSYQEFMAKSLL